MEIKCPKCGEALELPEEAVGAKVQCPFCEEKFVGENPVVLRLRPASVPFAVSRLPSMQRNLSARDESQFWAVHVTAQLPQTPTATEFASDAERKAQDACAKASTAADLMEMLKKFDGRALTLIQKDNIKSFKEIIHKEAKTEKDLLWVHRKIRRFITEERLDWMVDGDPSWNVLAIEDDLGKNAEVSVVSAKAKAHYEREKEAILNRFVSDDSFSRDDYDRAVLMAIEKSRKAGYDPCPSHTPADYAKGLDEGAYVRLLGGESTFVKALKQGQASRESIEQKAIDDMEKLKDIIIQLESKKKKKSGIIVESAGLCGNVVRVKLNFDLCDDVKFLVRNRDEIACALCASDLQINLIEGTITYSHNAQDFHVLGEEFSDSAIAKAFTSAAVPVIVGRSGYRNYLEDMRDRAPHIMVVGEDGSGKTTFGRSILAGWLMKDPFLVTPFVIDPNGVYEDICKGTPMVGYAGGAEKILPALEFLNNELERRMAILHGWIDEYNDNPPIKPMPMMPVLFDDVDDALDSDSGGRIRKELDSLARSGAKCGINVVVLSRRASVLPDGVRINIGARIVFRVAENKDSVGALGAGHPEAVMALGRGDGYYCIGSGGGPVRIQAPILNDDSSEGQAPDIRKIIAKRNLSARSVAG